MDPQNQGVEQFTELLQQIQDLAGVGIKALKQAAGGGNEPPAEGAPPEGAPDQGGAPPEKPPAA